MHVPSKSNWARFRTAGNADRRPFQLAKRRASGDGAGGRRCRLERGEGGRGLPAGVSSASLERRCGGDGDGDALAREAV